MGYRVIDFAPYMMVHGVNLFSERCLSLNFRVLVVTSLVRLHRHLRPPSNYNNWAWGRVPRNYHYNYH